MILTLKMPKKEKTMTREIKVNKIMLETNDQLTEDEINAIKKSLSGQTIKTVSPDGTNQGLRFIEAICHVESVHTPQMIT